MTYSNVAQQATGDHTIEIFRLARGFGAFTAVDRVKPLIYLVAALCVLMIEGGQGCTALP